MQGGVAGDLDAAIAFAVVGRSCSAMHRVATHAGSAMIG